VRRVRPALGLGLALLGLMLLAALFAASIAPHDPYAQSLLRRLRPPVWEARGTWDNPFGTDGFGRDTLSRLLYGTRISLAVGFGGAALAGVIGASLGIAAGYAGGRLDRLIGIIIATRLVLPALLVALAVLQIAGSGLGIVILVLGLTSWDRYAVVLRTATAQVCVQGYVLRARVLGCSHLHILAREIFPNVASLFAVVFTFEAAQCILAAAALSFLGLGIQAPDPSWGLMMAEGRRYLTTDPWQITLAGAALATLVLAINLVGDGVRDWLAPELQR
jgi:peptide/nickel transport system permease protein